jgi:protein SCO1
MEAPGRVHRAPGLLAGGGPRLVLAALALIVILALATLVRGTGGGGGTSAVRAPGSAGVSASGDGGPSASGPGDSGGPIDVASYLETAATPAPPMRLTDQDDRPFDLASLKGSPVFVFFGYTHCADVCPATVGTVGLAMEAFGGPVRAVFVTVDPERDTPASLREYVRYLATGFAGLTGAPDRIAAVASDWGVRYAREETGTPGDYGMSHTADVLLVDARGDVRARFPFGTSAMAMTATLRMVVATTIPPTTAPVPTSAPSSATASPAGPTSTIGGLGILVASTSIWAGPAGPVILGLSAGGYRIDDPDLAPVVQIASIDGTPVGPPVTAVAVRPPGETRVLYVASPAIPSPGWWRLEVSADRGGTMLSGSTDIAALDPGATSALGAPAPMAHTPTLDDVGGNARAITTDPAPDLRLSRTSTTDALAAHRPFVLVIDSWKFRVTSACGKALVMARYLVDRWPDDSFIHLEPLRYDVVTDTPLLEGSLSDPTLTDPAVAWGLAGEPWGATSMPWIFVVDGNGIVRAKSEGVFGTDDVDVILALVATGH